MVEVHLYKPYAHQKAVHDAITHHITHIERFTDGFQKTFVVKAPRQVGKSAMVENELLRFALTFNGSRNAYIAPSFNISLKVYREIYNMLIEAGLIKKANATDQIIELINGSLIQFFSAAQRDKLRGFTVTGLLVIDEAAYIRDSIFQDMLSPWTDAKKAVTLMISSPDFEVGFFYEFYKMGLDGENNVESFDFTNFDLTVIRSLEKLEEKRKTMPIQTFRAEYLGLFKKAESSVFGSFKHCILQHAAAKPTALYLGLDFGTGSGKDYTVLSGLNQNREQCLFWRTNELSPGQQIDKIGEIIAEYKAVIRGMYVEQNSIGKIYLDMLRKKLGNLFSVVTPFNTSNTSKRKIVELLQVAIQNSEIKILNEREQISELSLYESKVNKTTGTVSYNAPEGAHDDTVISLMLANQAFIQKTSNNYRFNII